MLLWLTDDEKNWEERHGLCENQIITITSVNAQEYINIFKK